MLRLNCARCRRPAAGRMCVARRRDIQVACRAAAGAGLPSRKPDLRAVVHACRNIDGGGRVRTCPACRCGTVVMVRPPRQVGQVVTLTMPRKVCRTCRTSPVPAGGAAQRRGARLGGCRRGTFRRESLRSFCAPCAASSKKWLYPGAGRRHGAGRDAAAGSPAGCCRRTARRCRRCRRSRRIGATAAVSKSGMTSGRRQRASRRPINAVGLTQFEQFFGCGLC